MNSTPIIHLLVILHVFLLGCTSDSAGLDAGTASDSGTRCAANQVRVNYAGSSICLDRCTSDLDCATCCVPQATANLCAPNLGECAGGVDAGSGVSCQDRSSCLSLEWRMDDPCLYYTATNTCGEHIDYKVCAESGSGSWTCGQWDLEPYQTDGEAVTTCESPTRRYLAGAVLHPAAIGCFAFP